MDFKAAFDKIHVVRVPAYSPHAVAEHAMALILTLNRKIHCAYIRTRDFNFSINGFTGFDLYGKTMGIIGTVRSGVCLRTYVRVRHEGYSHDPFPAKDSG